MKLNCVIIDDEPLALELMESYVKKTPFLELTGKYHSAIQAMKDMSAINVDLIYLDIQMPELNGLDFAKMLNNRSRIIFTTAFQQYAVDSYKVNALDYLMKPISYVDFLKSANKAMNWFELINQQQRNGSNNDVAVAYEENNSIYVKTEHKIIQLKYTDIIYVECIKDYVKIFVQNEEFPIVSLMTMKYIERKFPADQFIRVHRSYLVRKDRIKEIDHNQIIFDDVRIPISTTYRLEVQKYLNMRKK